MSNEEARKELRETVLIQVGRDKRSARTSYWISKLTGIHERAVRELIEELREEGHLICNDQDGEGYYLSDDIEDIRRQYARDRARALSILKRLRPFRRKIHEAEKNQDQQNLFDKE